MEIKRKNKNEKFELYLMVACCIVLVRPDITRAAKPVKELATYTIIFSGDLEGSGYRENMPVFENRIEHMPLQQPLDLHAFFVSKIGQAEADICFPYPSKGIHGINPIQQHPERGAIITLFFDGKDHDRKDLMYRLDLTGYFADLSNWTPASGTTSDVILTNWEVQSDTKGGRNKACQADGELNETVTVYREPTTTNAVETLDLDIDSDTSDDNAIDYGWMNKAPERLGAGFVSAIALSPDGKVIAAAHRTNTTGYRWQAHTVFLWDPQTREQIAELRVDHIRSIAFSPDGSLLALGAGNHTIYLWDVAGQNQVGVINSPGPYSVIYLAFSPDGMLLASTVDSDTSAHLWDVQSQSHIGTLNGRTWSIVFNPDGNLVVAGGTRSDPRIKLWDVETQNQIGTLTGHLDITYDLDFSPDGSVLASAGGWNDKAVYLWDIDTQVQVGVLSGHSAHVGSIAFSPDGTLLASTAYWDNTVYVWDVAEQTQIGVLNGHDATDFGWGDQVEISSDGKWLVCGSENGVELWEANLSGAVPQTSAFGPQPRDNSMHDDTWATLSWRPGIYASSHDVYVGDNFNDVNEGINDVYFGNLIDTFLLAGFPGYPYPGGLVPGTTYYWRIDEVNDIDPNSPWKGPVWSFKIPPKEAYNPSPADGDESVELDAVLSWQAGFGAILHTLYFGDNFDDVANATEGLLLTQTNYAPGTLESGKTYYVRVDEFDGIETHKGDIWSFTTISIDGN